MDVCIADVSEDHILAGKLRAETLAIECQHLAIACKRHREVRPHFQTAILAHNIVDHLRHRVTELAKALAIGRIGSEPRLLDKGPGTFQPVEPQVGLVAHLLLSGHLLFDKDRGVRSGRSLGEARSKEPERRSVDILEHAQTCDVAPLVNGVQRRIVARKKYYAGQKLAR